MRVGLGQAIQQHSRSRKTLWRRRYRSSGLQRVHCRGRGSKRGHTEAKSMSGEVLLGRARDASCGAGKQGRVRSSGG